MMDKIVLRKEAIRRHLQGESKTEISRALGKTRYWVNTWIKRYDPDDPEGSLADRLSTPKEPYRKWPREIINYAIQSRKLRMEAKAPGYEYALIGAEAIHYEMKSLGIKPTPPVRTIHYWLKEADLVVTEEMEAAEEEKVKKPYPAPKRDQVNELHQLDFKGPFYLSGSDQKHYLLALRDYASKRVALGVARNRKAQSVADFIVKAWQRIGLPRVIQMDNGLEFRGSNRYPRSFGKVVHICLDLDIEPYFIPQREPWRNGFIENCNGLINRLLLKRHNIPDFSALEIRTKDLETAINSTHRLSDLAGLTPNEYAANQPVCLLDPGYNGHLCNLPLVKGKISFIRLVRKSGRITLCAKDKFDVGTEYQWLYVRAQVDIQSQIINVFYQNELVKSLEYLL